MYFPRPESHPRFNYYIFEAINLWIPITPSEEKHIRDEVKRYNNLTPIQQIFYINILLHK